MKLKRQSSESKSEKAKCGRAFPLRNETLFTEKTVSRFPSGLSLCEGQTRSRKNLIPRIRRYTPEIIFTRCIWHSAPLWVSQQMRHMQEGINEDSSGIYMLAANASPERQKNEKDAVWIFLFFSMLKGTLLNRFFLILVWILVSFLTPGTGQKRRNNVHYTKILILRSRDRPGFRFGVILNVFFVCFICFWSHSQTKRVFWKTPS